MKPISIKPFPKIRNIRAIPIPIPIEAQLITVNLYAVGEGPITLIDTGPKFQGTIEYIETQLNSAGFEFNDIDRILATHAHVDHTGIVEQICKRIEHPVRFYVHKDDSWMISRENHNRNLWEDDADALMALVGVPHVDIQKIRERFLFFKELCDPVENVFFLENDDEFLGNGYNLKVIHTPGHTAGSVCFYESGQKILFSGDTVIKHITPNPLIEIKKFRLENPKYQSLPIFLKSLEKIGKLEVRYVFSGHGEFIDNVQTVIETYKAHHRQRMELVWKALDKKSCSIYQLVNKNFPVIPEGDIFLAISEVVAHLEMLVNEGRAELIDRGPPALYRSL